MDLNENEKSLIAIIIKNVPGVLAKIAGYCGDNNMNIERLVISNFKSDNLLQKMVLSIVGNRVRINNLVEDIKKLDVVVDAFNFQANNYFERELVLLKMRDDDEKLNDVQQIMDNYNGRTIKFINHIVIMQFINDEEKTSELLKFFESLDTKFEIVKSGLVVTSLNDTFSS